MTLAVRNGQAVAENCRAVRGVVLSRQTVPIGGWAATLASELVSYAKQNAQAARPSAANRRQLSSPTGRPGAQVFMIVASSANAETWP